MATTNAVTRMQSHENIGGLFNKLFEFAMSRDDKLRGISLSMPQNAKYMSPLIQNEVIDLMARMVQDAVVQECQGSDVKWYSIKCDETRGSCNVENMSIVIRYVINGKPVEHMLSMIKVAEVDAKSLTRSLLGELQNLRLDQAYILCQCYDGASVMSGAKGGVQKILQDTLSRKIPYVHCYNHQLHQRYGGRGQIGEFFQSLRTVVCVFPQECCCQHIWWR